MEYKAGVDSGVCVLARKSRCGTQRKVRNEVTVTNDDGSVESYHITKFMRSNQGTCINQVPVVDRGERIQAGQVIADGPANQQTVKISLGKKMR